MEPGFFQITLKVFLRHGDAFLVLRDRITQAGDLPGGRLSRSEFYGDWTAAIRRELREELGPDLACRLDEEPLFLFPHPIVSAGTDGLGVAYRAAYRGGPVRLSEEHDAYEWVPIATYDPSGFFTEPMARAVRRYQRLVRSSDVGVPAGRL